MLILPNGKDKTDLRLRPTQLKPKVEGAPHLVLNRLPTPGDGCRLPTMKELAELMKDPKMRAAVDIIEKDMGSPTALKVALHKDLSRAEGHRKAVAVQVKARKMTIDKAVKIKEGRF